MKQVIIENAREKVLKGANIVADAVRTTFGANGQNVIVETLDGQPHVTKDGFTVSENIFLSDHAENMGAQIIKQAARKTVELAGDGTTTSIILTQAIINAGMREITNGYSPIKLKRELDLGVEKVVKALKESAIKVNGDYEKIKQVATISANNDVEIGTLIADAFQKATEDGYVKVETSKTFNSYLESKNGMQITEGFVSPYFINNAAKNITELINPMYFLTDKAVSSHNDILSVANLAAIEKRPLVIIAPEVSGEALAALVTNSAKGNLPSVAIKSPNYGDNQTKLMQDISKVTGAVYFHSTSPKKVAEAKIEDFGGSEKVVVNQKETIIIGGRCSKEDILEYSKSVVINLNNATTANEKEFHEKRKSNLIGGICVVYVGAHTEVELKEKKDRIEDAIQATKSAIEEGIGTGGGLSYYSKIECIGDSVGERVLNIALQTPIEIIHELAGVEFMGVVGNVSLNAKTGKYCDLFEAGVIDPIKVSRVALENACSAAGMILLTNCLVVKEDK